MARRSTLASALLLLTVATAGAAATPTASAFRLFASGSLLLTGNNATCTLLSFGYICSSGSPVVEDGVWPLGTRDTYMFGGGLQLAALIPGVPSAGFPWPGDTIGAFAFDPRGDQRSTSAVTGLYDSRTTPADQWPSAARLLDTALFDARAIGAPAASRLDSWVRYWDVNGPNVGRRHPMGVLVEQRTMQWPYPRGNDDIIYMVFRVVNVTASDPARYAGLAAAGYDPGDIADFAQLGRIFQARMRLDQATNVPDSGFTFDQMYVAYSRDPDVGDAGRNYVTASFPFDLEAAYKSDFSEPSWIYPSAIFVPPFAHAPGFVAQALLSAPGGRELHFWSQTTGGGQFPDAIGVSMLWRKLSVNFLPQDGFACDVPGGNAAAAARRFCFAGSIPSDARDYMSVGPLTLRSGESALFVMAMVLAPAVQAPIAAGSIPGYGLQPGFPIDGTRLVQGLDTVRNVDRAMGWVSATDVNGDGTIEWNEVNAVRRSLLWKTQLAHAVAASHFLLPAPPAAPEFVAIPGDGRVTLAWSRSATEATGDPFFSVASDPTSALYDPDFRRYDVEGYRVWRGAAPNNLELVAQLDYAGTAFLDYAGQFDLGTDKCAPELGVTATCPAFPVQIPIASPVVQYDVGDRVQLIDSSVAILRADTAVTGGGTGYPPLTDTGVPFVWVDTTVTNGVTYYYAVTAFSVNSVRSAPSSFESSRVVKSAAPRLAATNLRQAQYTTLMVGGDGTPLDAAAAQPAIDANAGSFTGAVPPATRGSVALLGAVAEALPAGDFAVRIDSIGAGWVTGFGPPPTMYLSFLADTLRFQASVVLPMLSFNSSVSGSLAFSVTGPLVPYDSAQAVRLGLPRSFVTSARMTARFSDATGTIAATSPGVALANGRYGAGGTSVASRYLAHSRWYSDGAAEPADPTIDFNPSASHNSGQLAGVDTIWAVEPYRVPLTGAAAANPQISANLRAVSSAATSWYPADYVVTWGAGGAITVYDATHHVNLPFMTHMGSGYGFVSLAKIAAAGITDTMLSDANRTARATLLEAHSLYTVNPVCTSEWWNIPCADLVPTASLQPLDLNEDGISDGSCFLLILNDEPFMMKLGALPAAGTKWHLRAIGGGGMGATCTPALAANLTTPPGDCSGYTWNPPPDRPALAPGLRFTVRVSQAFAVLPQSGDLSRVHPVPDPYYRSTSLEALVGQARITFVNLPDRCIVRIYSASGILVALLTHNDPSGGGQLDWDVTSRNGRQVASGVYFWELTTFDGRHRVGRMTIVTGER